MLISAWKKNLLQMPVSNLLELNPDKLFEEHSISEIQEIQKKLQSEIDRKREELRTMVGERYRDLIEAADTIADMKATAEGIVSHIDKMTDKCQQLQEQQLLGFTSSSSTKMSSGPSAKSSFYSVAVQIRVLIVIPEHIWIAFDEEDYLRAAQLYLFARHMNTGLQLQSGGDSGLSGKQIEYLFPVVERQWSTISDFLPTILKNCEEKIQKQDATNDEVAKSLCAFALLEGLSSQQLLARFLELRTHALQRTLQSESYTSVKACVLDSVKLLVQTFSLLQACFVGTLEDGIMHEGLIYQNLKAIVGQEAPPSISLIELRDTIGFKLLPAVILDFRPSSPQQVDPLLPGSLRETLSSWVDTTREYVSREVTELLKLVRTLRGLAAVRGGHAAVSQEHAAICRSLLVPQGADLWGTFFRPSLSSRAHRLVNQQWCSALQKVKNAVSAALRDISYTGLHQPEQDLRWFVWKEWETDLPQAAQEASDARGLLMKAKGYSPRIEKLCLEFDSQLEGLLKDLNHYIEDHDSTSASKTFAESSEEHSDRKQLQEHLQTCSLDNMKQLINYVHEKQSSDCDRNPLLLSRFLQAVCDLCPHLQQCLMPQNCRISVHSFDGPQEVTPWQEVCSLLKHESLLTWSRWQECISKRIQKLVSDTLFIPTDMEKLMCVIPQWEVVPIEEEGKDGHIVKSESRVPSQPSLPLQALLNSICHEVNSVAPHTLPRKIHQDLVECIIGLIFDFYKSMTNTKPLTTAQSLQFLLDVKYLTLLLVPRDNKVLMASSQELCQKLESEVDPFYFYVFGPYIQRNIKSSVRRTQGLLGVLVAWPEKLCHTAPMRGQGSSSSSTSGQTGGIDDPSVLPLGPTVQWFPLLPVTGPAAGPRLTTTAVPTIAAGAATTVQQVDRSQPKKASTLKQKIDPSPGEIVRSGAAAFFGAMSTDWFG